MTNIQKAIWLTIGILIVGIVHPGDWYFWAIIGMLIFWTGYLLYQGYIALKHVLKEIGFYLSVRRIAMYKIGGKRILVLRQK